MTDELCAREGCGAPKAWHTTTSTFAELKVSGSRNHRGIGPLDAMVDGWCLSKDCDCAAYLAPEPPKPERKAWVVELDAAYADTMGGTAGFVPLDEYLAAHPQPAPALCICGGTADQHWAGFSCSHILMWCDERGDKVYGGFCRCLKFRAAQS